jgi:hypothetical protein
VSAKQQPQLIDPRVEQSPRPVDTTTRLRQILGLTRDEPAFTTDKLAELRGFTSAEAARKFLSRHRDVIAFQHRGRRLIVTLRDFDRGCERIKAARRKSA